MQSERLTRRTLIAGLGVAAAAPALASGVTRKSVGATGLSIPAIGMGSWRTFDVGADSALRAARADVLKAFFDHGGSLIDSSPMYGASQEVIGSGLARLGGAPSLFAADKVWTEGRDAGRRQIAASLKNWRLDRFDLLQVHNLVDWRAHLPILFEMKSQGQLRFVGITSYAGLRYDEMARIAETEPVDFIQITYNIADREAETELLPLAAERNIAVIANRPFREGALLERLNGVRLPPIAGEIGAHSWSQFLLKFIIAHPAVTAAIPATRRADHMIENMGALTGPLPDAAQRKEMIRAFEAL